MSEILTLAIDAALNAGTIIKSFHGKTNIKQKNSSYNLVTQADLESESSILTKIKQKMPDSVYLSEETNWQSNVMADSLWIIDPLDGTNNFAHSIPQYSVSIAYAEKGIVKTAVIYDPMREELFSAEKGYGAFLNGKKISVSDVKSLQGSVIATGFYYDRGEMMQNTLYAIFRLLKMNIQGIRRMGSAALDLCWVACGRYDGYFEYMLSPWDFAAGMLIVKEAGGIFCDRDCVDLGLNSKGVICSNGTIQQDLLNTVKWKDICNLSELRLR